MTTKMEATRQAQEYLRRIPIRAQCFFAKDGSVYCSLEECLTGIKRMHPDTFKAHSNAEKSDFANWVRNVIGDKTLARSLEVARKSQKMAIHCLEARVKKLDKEIDTTADSISLAEHLHYF